jgi:hypothetical protein
MAIRECEKQRLLEIFQTFCVFCVVCARQQNIHKYEYSLFIYESYRFAENKVFFFTLILMGFFDGRFEP